MLPSLPAPEIHAPVQENLNKRDCPQEIAVDLHSATNHAPSTAAARTKAREAAEARARKADRRGVGDLMEVERKRARTEEQLKKGTADSFGAAAADRLRAEEQYKKRTADEFGASAADRLRSRLRASRSVAINPASAAPPEPDINACLEDGFTNTVYPDDPQTPATAAPSRNTSSWARF